MRRGRKSALAAAAILFALLSLPTQADLRALPCPIGRMDVGSMYGPIPTVRWRIQTQHGQWRQRRFILLVANYTSSWVRWPYLHLSDLPDGLAVDVIAPEVTITIPRDADGDVMWEGIRSTPTGREARQFTWAAKDHEAWLEVDLPDLAAGGLVWVVLEVRR